MIECCVVVMSGVLLFGRIIRKGRIFFISHFLAGVNGMMVLLRDRSRTDVRVAIL